MPHYPKQKRARRAGIGAILSVPVLVFALNGPAIANGLCGFKGGDPKAGSAIYHETCVACHGENGRGVVPGTPDFTKTGGGVLSKPHSVLTEHIENGFQEPGAPLAMPAQGGIPDLTDQDAKNVHAYLHKAFGCG